MREKEIIRKNIEGSKKLKRALRVLTDSQLLEASEILLGRPEEEVREFFEDTFQCSPICPEMLRLSVLLCKDKKDIIKKTPERITVSCSKNPLSLAASRMMCRDIKTVIITEESDFKSVCEAVASKETDYCILPMCSSLDGYYPTFSKLLKSYDLKICKTCRLSKQDSDEELQFALLSRRLEIPESPSHIAFSFVCDEPNVLPGLIFAISAGGCIPQSIISSPLEYNMDIFEHRVEAHLGDVSPAALLFFLEAALPRHIVLGIY